MKAMQLDNTENTNGNDGLETKPAPKDFRAKIRELRWRNAVAQVEQGKLNTATGELLEFARDHPGSPEAEKAIEYLVAIADEHAANGRVRMATDLYEKLADLT